MSNDPFDNILNLSTAYFGQHPTLGLSLCQCDIWSLPQLINIVKSIMAHWLPCWKSTLRLAYIMHVNDCPIHTIQDIVDHVQNA